MGAAGKLSKSTLSDLRRSSLKQQFVLQGLDINTLQKDAVKIGAAHQKMHVVREEIESQAIHRGPGALPEDTAWQDTGC